MRSNDPKSKFQDGFEPGPLQIGPDGGIQVSPQAKAIPPPPSLCEAGPCRNYHRFVTQLDAERPIGGAIEQGEHHGRVTGDPGPAPFHMVAHRYCYPTVGIETELDDLPVLDCNRWEPVGDDYDTARAVAERKEQYQRELAEWHAARAAELEEVVAAAAPFIRAVTVTVGGHDYEIAVDGDPMTIRALRRKALDAAYWPPSPPAPAPLDAYQLRDLDGNEITNLDATLTDLGIADGDRFTLTLPAGYGG